MGKIQAALDTSSEDWETRVDALQKLHQLGKSIALTNLVLTINSGEWSL